MAKALIQMKAAMFLDFYLSNFIIWRRFLSSAKFFWAVISNVSDGSLAVGIVGTWLWSTGFDSRLFSREPAILNWLGVRTLEKRNNFWKRNKLTESRSEWMVIRGLKSAARAKISLLAIKVGFQNVSHWFKTRNISYSPFNLLFCHCKILSSLLGRRLH